MGVNPESVARVKAFRDRIKTKVVTAPAEVKPAKPRHAVEVKGSDKK